MIKNIVSRSEGKDGKVYWNPVGTLIDNGDKQYVKLNFLPDTMFYVFEKKDREEKTKEAF